jgi:uncharacterized protein with PQ loop repeat
MPFSIPVLAGTLSSLIFLVGTIPMLHKAFRTKDLRSYSKGMLGANTFANVIHAIYVFSLPPGPIWALHTFHLVTTALMLFWYVRYEDRPVRSTRPSAGTVPAAA